MSAEDLHVPSAEPLQPDEASGEDIEIDDAALSEQLEEVQGMSAVDYAKKYGGYVAGAVVLGIVAAELIRRGKNRLTTPEGDEVIISERDARHLKGVISFVQRTRKHDSEATSLAISVPKDTETGSALQEGADKVALFAMRQRGAKDVEFSHPLRGDEQHVRRYSEGVRTVAGWLAKAVKPSKKPEK